ncbi:cyclohexanecarboxylate-CoA ligase [Thermomonospora echinospora]|uniref:Cyclohexanecarboxylate-CoA ligase n=1 Tax=Thermomonospora echinospora TaxID=1992 RepID=A0A1H6DXH4_9ACTN|nr:AMP-binding protein [Thermomonospora echinospora]SEG90042.1 cyclohexanecarboxylate-CoA ligase [Thermomonospora echinospora]
MPTLPTADADTWRASGWWRDDTFLDDLRRAAEATPDGTALVSRRVDGAPRETLTWAELADTVERLAAGLAGLGVRRGDVVAAQLPNGWRFVALALACARIGAAIGPIVPIMRRREVEFALRLTGSPVYVAAAEWRGFSYGDMVAEIAADLPGLRHRVLLDAPAGGGPGVLDFDRDLLGGDWAPVPADAAAGPDDAFQVIFTSGTTGEPKGVVHSHNTLYAMNRAQADVLHLTGDAVTAMGSPTTHQAGFTWNFLMPLLLGATSVQVDSWDADAMLRILEEERVSFFMGAPTFLADLIEAQRRAPRDLSRLTVFATGSAPIPPVVVEQAGDVLGCRLYALWGMTENGCVTITRPEDPPMRAAESDGTPVPGMEVRIVGDGGGAVGALQVRGASQCLGYFRRPEVYAASLTPDGWFDTGDLARGDGYGGIRIAGRVKDLISRGAEKIPVVEVEAALLRHAAVRDVAVVGYPDERLGERACAVLVCRGPRPSLADLQAHLAGLGMAKQYWPERLEFIDALPKTPSGKIQKFVLRERLRGEG